MLMVVMFFITYVEGNFEAKMISFLKWFCADLSYINAFKCARDCLDSTK